MDSSVQGFRKRLQRVAVHCAEAELNEREVIHLFESQGVFAALGYGTVGEDLRLEQRSGRGRIDVLLRGVTGRPICVIEFKRPGSDLAQHRAQLEDYVREILPEFAALTNGTELWFYRRREEALVELERFVFFEISESQARRLYQILRKRAVDWQRLDAVRNALRACREEAIRVTGPEQEGGRIFLQQFDLSPRVAFGRLTKALFEELPDLLSCSDFARGAYAFWEKIYARQLSEEEIEKLARRWRDFVGRNAGKQQVYRFMFALETAYAILSRLILAKAMQDADFQLDAVDTFGRELDARDRRGILSLLDYVHAVKAVFKEGKQQAFQSLFDGDIFDWWLDLSRLDEAAHEACEALAEAALAVFQFGFSDLSGDLLGQLYQSYFDPETRKALGEFYTPHEVVDFILDHVGYKGSTITTQRLLDPACGSGTFLVHALQRYLAASSGRDPRDVLRSLADGFRIVGFDVNPFAVLMAQVNYALHLLPTYSEALKRDRKFEILSLPVFRTDSLRQEKREGEKEEIEQEKSGTLGFTFEITGEIAKIRTELPIEVRRGEFLRVEIPVPRYDRVRHHGWLANVEEYFKMQHAMFVAVRRCRERGVPLSVEELRSSLARVGLAQAEELARYIYPTVEKILEVLEQLKKEYEDGRFLKTLEDLALAMTLKHELKYDFVVGNPPYVRIQKIPELSKKYWQGIYEWAEGNFDIFIPFIERAVIHWLKEGGRLGFICSDRFLLANYAEKLRRHLPKQAEIELIFDMRDTRVFKDALNYPAILIVRRVGHPEHRAFIAARVFADPGEGPNALLDEARGLIQRVQDGSTYVESEHVDAFREFMRHLQPQGWYLMPLKERRVFRKLERAATHRLYELTLTQSGGFQGLATGCDDVFVLKLVKELDKTLLLKPKGSDDRVEIEKDLLRPWLFGRDVERWHIAWDGWYVLFPYVKIKDKGKDKYKLIPCEENQHLKPFSVYADQTPRMEDFPRAWEYLNQDENKWRLREREGGRFAHAWYGVSRPQNLELYEKDKILIQATSTHPDIAYDCGQGFVFAASGTANVYGVLPITEVNPPWLLALLNSQVLDFYLKHISVIYAGKAYAYGDQFIKQLPICLPKRKREYEIVSALARQAQALTRMKGRLRAKEQKRAAFPAAQLGQLKERPEVYRLSRLVQGTPQRNRITVTNVQLLQQLGGSWALRFGRTELVFPSEMHALVVRAWSKVQGRSQVPAEWLMNLPLPLDERSCRRLLELLENCEQEIERLRKCISEMESDIDELAAELYRLNPRDKQVICKFLKRF